MKKKKFKRYDHTDGYAILPKGPAGKFLEIWLENVWSMIPLNVLYSFLRILLFPVGLAQVGMAAVAAECVRQRPFHAIELFFDALKKGKGKAFLAGLLTIFIWVFLLFVGYFYYTSSGILATMGLGCCLAAMLFFSVADHYIWVQIRFLRLPLGKIFKNACLFAFVNLKKNLVLIGVNLLYWLLAVCIVLLLQYEITLALLLLVTTGIYSGFYNLLVQYCVFDCVKECLIDPYYAEHPQEDLEQREKMGLI